MATHSVSDSDLGLLTFPDVNDYITFKMEERALYKKYHDLEVEKYGIFAGNQNKFVRTVEELNNFDPHPHPLDT